MIREERDGFRLLVDLTKGDRANAIAAVEDLLAVEGLIGISVIQIAQAEYECRLSRLGTRSMRRHRYQRAWRVDG